VSREPSRFVGDRERTAMTLMAMLGLVVVIICGFGAALIFSPATLDDVWRSFRGLPIPVQIVGSVLILPWVMGPCDLGVIVGNLAADCDGCRSGLGHRGGVPSPVEIGDARHAAAAKGKDQSMSPSAASRFDAAALARLDEPARRYFTHPISEGAALTGVRLMMMRRTALPSPPTPSCR
jgi:hypothetical protein